MMWLNACVTCGRDVNKKTAATRKLYGDIFYFDTEECAKVFDGTGSFLDALNAHSALREKNNAVRETCRK